ncbi:ClpXP protease specificity-enhancing factor [Kushneria phosphatilytica]|uniref:ClpXP protease specificity-enhancing factor n=1 Tax=Kushneria phosphatilytica TaxID=657387 RepID=A0A1S1NSJ8_9GAMM|nr:ClpXP protease specificity-enhancing factor [Kushneria phosphatilytica]OHV12234.1 ClpXP protease specificity-enhancing factor [Kushneria phosphatilytica]QEL11435.1 ClpXP protease specificity-enhancing factor [Kushneria phosphatilytica]
MLSSRPYLTRALYQWLLDNDQTPYIVVDARQPGVIVPEQFVQNGQIVLNINPDAIRDLFMENDMIAFNARFGGQPMDVQVPIEALIAIYARENGIGMVFGQEPVMPAPEENDSSGENEESGGAHLESIEGGASEESAGDEEKDDDHPPRKGRPSLRVIK